MRGRSERPYLPLLDSPDWLVMPRGLCNYLHLMVLSALFIPVPFLLLPFEHDHYDHTRGRSWR